jgi:hypothetical protein
MCVAIARVDRKGTRECETIGPFEYVPEVGDGVKAEADPTERRKAENAVVVNRMIRSIRVYRSVLTNLNY